jgi:hypothetical protein
MPLEIIANVHTRPNARRLRKSGNTFRKNAAMLVSETISVITTVSVIVGTIVKTCLRVARMIFSWGRVANRIDSARLNA